MNLKKVIDLLGDDEDVDYIRYKALDTVCMKYEVEEEQIKHSLYVSFILTN